MTPTAALSLIPGFSEARMGSLLSDGPSNTSMMLHLDGAQYVLRLDKPGARALGLNRASEQLVCAQVSAAGIAPEPVYFDPVRGIYLRHFTPGVVWTEWTLQSADALERLAELLRTLHQLPEAATAEVAAKVAKFDPGAAARRYAGQLATAQAQRLARRAGELLTKLKQGQHRTCLCHNDLVCGNILEADRLMLIDWEYAGIGDPWFDLAVVVQHHGLPDKLTDLFIQAYLQREASAGERARLWLQCRFYQCLLDLWYLRIGSA